MSNLFAETIRIAQSLQETLGVLRDRLCLEEQLQVVMGTDTYALPLAESASKRGAAMSEASAVAITALSRPALAARYAELVSYIQGGLEAPEMWLATPLVQAIAEARR